MSTTNAEDQRKAAELKARLAQKSNAADGDDAEASSNDVIMPAVTIDEGANKYVLILAGKKGHNPRHFVVSSRYAEYHKDAAELMVAALERDGHNKIEILGGGRITLDSKKKSIAIFGFSYGFGLADHAISKKVVEADKKYMDFNITTSDEGY